ncbi:MAG: hypothetical protein A2787_05305 [Omnitrophica WOR_2 bacterium RIFCSPHIGHO2_01_FULL_48_9]|nr:MAG: hypothetical protein A3D10_04315 [Omnitrophica WOR_2 bacterium RIFCSPHIGHO2_02_FULL_48_11]OGX34023.1 MAG: hypothetical protein A2787_05305 [Omnitrophica WOR_2 bacterium RIFCSPHIGHO2_01_FULL_48_9]
MRAILLISHGSRSAKTKQEVAALVKRLERKSKISILEYAFLELERPSIPQGIDRCIKKGASEVVLLLNFLNSGRHVDQDIPQIVKDAKKRYPHVRFKMTSSVGQHKGIADLFAEMISR